MNQETQIMLAKPESGKVLLNDKERADLEREFTREHQQVVQGLTNIHKHFHRASDLLVELHHGTVEGQWENVLKRLNISRATAFRYLAAARELKQIPASVKAAVESVGLDLTSAPVRQKVLEVQEGTKEPDLIAELVGEEYLHQRKRRKGSHPAPPRPAASPKEKVRQLLFSILEKAYRDSNENLEEALKRFDSIIDEVRETFVSEHQRSSRPKKVQI
jgi:hypothetical protein